MNNTQKQDDNVIKQLALLEIKELVNSYTPKEPYISNTLFRIKDILQRAENGTYTRRHP